MGRDSLFTVSALCDKYGGKPSDYLYPDESNPFFRLAIDTLCLQIHGEYESQAYKIQELDRTPTGGRKSAPSKGSSDPVEIRNQFEKAFEAVNVKN